eukprot:9057330-Alexandrium_andersonii.AAC.1
MDTHEKSARTTSCALQSVTRGARTHACLHVTGCSGMWRPATRCAMVRCDDVVCRGMTWRSVV